jgi:predicted TIM-barrel fold metal-dependent hydrolase
LRIVDCHAHAFHDKIAEKAADNLAQYYGIPMSADGLFETLKARAEKAGVTKMIVNASATKPSQVRMTNDFVASVTTENIIGFGTLHYAFTEADAELDRMEALGLRGLKFHPVFQGFAIDDAKMYPIYERLAGRFPILIHVGDRNTDAARPKRLAKVLTDFPRLVAVAPHLGGYSEWDEAEAVLLGGRFENLYIDTSSAIRFLPPARALELIRFHGAERTLFGSDYPISSAGAELALLDKIPLTDAEREQILWKNAYRLLGLEE